MYPEAIAVAMVIGLLLLTMAYVAFCLYQKGWILLQPLIQIEGVNKFLVNIHVTNLNF